MAETTAASLHAMRRPKRGRPPRPGNCGKEVEEDDHAPPRSKRKRKLDLIDIVKHYSSRISHVVKTLVEDYESNPKSVLFKILTMLFQACGARHDLCASDLHEAPVDDIVIKLVELARKGLVDDNYSSKREDLKNFKENLVTFWDSLVLECQNGPLFDNKLFTTINDYVVAISWTPPRVYRQMATLVGIHLVMSFISVAKTLSGQCETTQRQLDAEKKKQSDGPAVESLNRRLSITHQNITYLEQSMIEEVFERLFKYRYRDVDPEIRMLCIKSLGIWVVSYPLFLQDEKLKYLGFALSDENAGVRRTSILALQILYDVPAIGPSLGLFAKVFSKRIIKLADDIDISVAVPAIRLVKQLLRLELLSEDADISPLVDLLFAVSPMVRRAIGEFVYDHLIAQNCKTPSVARDGDNESSEIHIVRMLDILRIYSDDPVRSSYVIDDICDDMKAMKDWKCIISMLLAETPIAKLTDMDGTDLVRMLLASAKKAVGERIIPATDNRKMNYSKSEKEIFENSKRDITNALMTRYPQLLRKYLPDKAKISPLIDMMMLLKVEMYSLKRQEQNFKAAIDLIVDAFFKHDDDDTLKSCIKAIAFCCTNCRADLLDYAENKLKTLEDELVLKVKTAIKEVEAGDSEYSLLVNLKRLYELQLSKPVKNDGLFEDMYRILSHLGEMDDEVKIFLLDNMFLEAEWCLDAIDVENPSETSIDGLSSKQSTLFGHLYNFLVVLKEGRSATVLSSRVCIITAEMWCLFKKSKYSSTKLKKLGYVPKLDNVKRFWELCEQQLNISDDTEDEDAKKAYIEDINRDAVMLAAAKLLLLGDTDTTSKDYLGPEIVSHYVSHGASTTEIIEHVVTTLKKNATFDITALFFEALRRAYERYMAHDGEKRAKSFSECQDLANRLAGYYAGAARFKYKSEILKFIKCGVEFAFVDLPKQLPFLEAALVAFVSKLASSHIPDILTDLKKKRAQDTDVNQETIDWRPYNIFAERLGARNEGSHVTGKEEKRKGGRPRKTKHGGEEEEDADPFRVGTKSIVWVDGDSVSELDGRSGIAVVEDTLAPRDKWHLIPVERFALIV